MPRRARICPGGLCYHVLNRAVARLTLFENPEDYEAFERVLEEAIERVPLRVLSYLVMPNHWHFVVRPRTDSEVSEFFRWLTHTHTMRWHAQHHTEGTGHLYQGRFKTFPIEDDEHLLTVIRYVERNALRANLVKKAEDWKYSSLWRRQNTKKADPSILADWPVPKPRQWRAWVNKPQPEAELMAIRQCVRKGSPFGSERFVSRSAVRLKLEHTLRPRGRPRKDDGAR